MSDVVIVLSGRECFFFSNINAVSKDSVLRKLSQTVPRQFSCTVSFRVFSYGLMGLLFEKKVRRFFRALNVSV